LRGINDQDENKLKTTDHALDKDMYQAEDGFIDFNEEGNEIIQKDYGHDEKIIPELEKAKSKEPMKYINTNVIENKEEIANIFEAHTTKEKEYDSNEIIHNINLSSSN